MALQSKKWLGKTKAKNGKPLVYVCRFVSCQIKRRVRVINNPSGPRSPAKAHLNDRLCECASSHSRSLFRFLQIFPSFNKSFCRKVSPSLLHRELLSNLERILAEVHYDRLLFYCYQRPCSSSGHPEVQHLCLFRCLF